MLTFTGFSAEPADKRAQAAQELQAARLLEASLHNRPLNPEDRRKLGELYGNLKTKFPADANVCNAYAEFLWEISQHEQAIAQWNEAEKLEPGNAATLHGIGNAALAGGEIRKAADYLKKASAAQPTHAGYHFELANVLFLFRHELLDASAASAEAVIDRALKHYAEACRLAPLNVDFARGYAETFYGAAKPDWNAALAAWQHLLEISPKKDFALANLATVNLKLGRKDQARGCVEQMQSPEFAVRKARLLERIEKE